MFFEARARDHWECGLAGGILPASAGSCPREPGASGDREQGQGMGEMRTNGLEPDVAALALSQSVVLREAVQTAGTVRDLVYDCMTQNKSVFNPINMMFTDAIDAIPYAPDRVDKDFASALRAAGSPPDSVAVAIKEASQEEVKESMSYMAHWGAVQAVADGFAAALPDETGALAGRSSGRPGGSAGLDHLSMLAKTFHAAAPPILSGWSQDGQTEAAFYRAARAAAFRAADEAWGFASSSFALGAAASAVMMASIPDEPRDFLRHTAPGICRDLSKAISLAGGSQELALAIPAAILEGALEYPDDGIGASGETVVRGLRATHMWTSARFAIAAFRTVSGMAAGAAWATAGDRARFESTYDRALEAAEGVDPVVHYAFDPATKYSWKKAPFDHADEDTWKFFYDASGHTMAEWAEMARGVDYRHVALSQENAAVIGVYGAAYDGASEAAARIALEMRESGR